MSSLGGLDTLGTSSAMVYKGDNFCDFLFYYPVHQASYEKESTLKRVILLPPPEKVFALWRKNFLQANSFLKEWNFLEGNKNILTEVSSLINSL